LVAVIGNINCTIEKQSSSSFLASGQLYDLKRDLLWILYDHGALSKFPFGLLELGDCEENRGSPRSEEWVQVDNISEPILQNEKLFLDAIHINKTLYDEAQVYPYFCKSSCGHTITLGLRMVSPPFGILRISIIRRWTLSQGCWQ
jgi:hypothetical protein